MRYRFRLAAALLALLALTTSVVEQAWAAGCLKVEESSTMAAPAPESGASHAHHPTGAPDDRRAPDTPDPDSCPMVVASGMVCGAAALPVRAAVAPMGAEVHVSLLPASDETPGSLAISSLFRPPRR